MKPEMIPFLRKAVEWVEAEDKKDSGALDREWNQWTYITTPEDRAKGLSHLLSREVKASECGTACCVAGWVGIQLEPEYALDWQYGGVDVDDFVQEQLGLTPYEADCLFAGWNTAEQIRFVAEEIAGEKL